MSLIDRRGLQLDALQRKMVLAKRDLDAYQADYIQCQMVLASELQHRNNVEQRCMELQQRNFQLEAELQLAHRLMASHQLKADELQAALGENDRLRRAKETHDQLQAERIELLAWEIAKLRHLAVEADRTAQHSGQRAEQLCQRLACTEQQLEASRSSQMALQAELAAAAQNLRCVERAFELSAHQLQLLDRQLVNLKQRLRESERRAQLAELTAHQLQLSSAQLERRIEEQLEERWLQKIFKPDLQVVARD